MEENKRTELDKINEKKEIMTPKDYRSIFWRSFTIQGSWSFDKILNCKVKFHPSMEFNPAKRCTSKGGI